MGDMTSPDLSKLRALTVAADRHVRGETEDCESREAYLDAVRNPATILSLLDSLAAARAECERLTKEHADLLACHAADHATTRQQLAEVTAERDSWQRKFDIMQDGERRVQQEFTAALASWCEEGTSLRAQLAAMTAARDELADIADSHLVAKTGDIAEMYRREVTRLRSIARREGSEQ